MDRIPWYDLILAFPATGAALYLFFDHDGLVHRQGVLLETRLFGLMLPFEAVLAGVGIVLLLEATRRAIGLERFVAGEAPAASRGTPGGAAAYGLTLEAGGDGRYTVADLAVNGPAERAGFDYGDDVDEIDVERLGQPAKEWVWILAFGLLGLVLLMQGIRWRRRQPPPRTSD